MEVLRDPPSNKMMKWREFLIINFVIKNNLSTYSCIKSSQFLLFWGQGDGFAIVDQRNMMGNIRGWENDTSMLQMDPFLTLRKRRSFPPFIRLEHDRKRIKNTCMARSKSCKSVRRLSCFGAEVVSFLTRFVAVSSDFTRFT